MLHWLHTNQVPLITAACLIGAAIGFRLGLWLSEGSKPLMRACGAAIFAVFCAWLPVAAVTIGALFIHAIYNTHPVYDGTCFAEETILKLPSTLDSSEEPHDHDPKLLHA